MLEKGKRKELDIDQQKEYVEEDNNGSEAEYALEIYKRLIECNPLGRIGQS